MFTKAERPEDATFRALHFRLSLSSLPVQPFANEVRSHVCREGSNQGKDEVHSMYTSSQLRRADSSMIITHRPTKSDSSVGKFRRMLFLSSG